MPGTLRSREPIGQARRAWEEAERQGELEWLEDQTFIPASCLATPVCTSRPPRAWERVAVPPANASRRSDHKIYKRITARPRVDDKYQATIAELESQGFGERKRARAGFHVSPYGDALFEEREEDEISGQEMLDNAREQMMSALQGIWKDNLRLRESGLLRRKHSTYDPVQLTWVPRKRHNTRWPITPPGETCDFIAELQPLIRFELHPSQIDEAQGLQQQDEEQRSTLRSATPGKRAEQGQKYNRGHRRRTLRPSLGTISEVDDEPPMYPVLTPGAEARRVYTSPSKSVNGAGRFRTPTKVAESPMKIFTITATQIEDGERIEVTNSNGHFQISSPTDAGTTTKCRPIGINCPESNHEVHGDIYTEKTKAVTPTSGAPENSSNNIYLSALPFFDAPIPAAGVHDEPEHEARRRISLDNARRSDRRSDAKVIKRVNYWMEGTTTSKAKTRRYSELPGDLTLSQPKTTQKRRHTLDVDVGRNLDIFGQQAEAAALVDVLPSPTTLFTKPPSDKPASTIPSIGDFPSTEEDSVNPPSLFQNSNLPAPIPGDLHPTTLINGGNAVIQGAKETGLESVADMEREVAMDASNEVNETAGVADQIITDTNDQTACAVTEQAEIDAMAAEQDEPHNSGVQQMESTATSNDDVFFEKEETFDGDSALADLHSFVRRAKSSKERKDVPATALLLPLTTSSSKKKRRSGSLGSATSESGSPMTKTEKTTTSATTTMTSPRVPLGQKDANKSPSPSKKRKLTSSGPQEATAPIAKKRSGGRLVAPDLEDYETESSAQPKKRRRKMEADSGGDIFNPDMFPSQDLTKRTSSSAGSAPDKDSANASRRSSRIATVKKTAAIPVRLPGSSALDLGDMPAPSTAAVTARKADRDLAAQTRANTDRNKGGAMSVPFVLANLENAVAGDDGQNIVSITMPKKGTKNVRWDQILVRVQGEELPAAAVTDNVKGAAEEEDMALPPPPQLRFASDSCCQPENPVGDLSADDDDEDQEKKEGPAALSPAPIRRSARAAASRLPTRGGSVTPVKKKTALPSPSPGSVSKSSAKGVAGARARLGMAGPGTPGPRRGGRRR